jgi:Flp pilus assembly protein TadD
MTAGALLKQRHVVPRWRPLRATVSSGELAMPSQAITAAPRRLSEELVRRLEAWRLQPDIMTAAEVLETALVDGHPEEAVRPARFLLEPRFNAAPLVREQAIRLLREINEGTLSSERSNPRSSVARWRSATRATPQDPHAWVKLALAYVTIGKDKPALRAMGVALTLAPHDRHVLRSASRLFLHRHDAERAHDLLRTNSATPSDPWLIAGEIALAWLAERSPRFFKAGVNMVEDSGMRPRQLSELASAIGTEHLMEGNKKARRLFRSSLIDPTGNSLAQAEWASSRITGIIDPTIIDRSEDSVEARVLQAYWLGDFREVINRSRAWYCEEPYSSRAPVAGSFAAITIEDYESALQFCDDGLKRNPDQPILKNNRAYALIATGRPEEAVQLIASVRSSSDGDWAAMATATEGFREMRYGDRKYGAALYRQAIEYFARTNPFSEANARAYFAVEAARGELPDAAQVLEEARAASKRVPLLKEAPVLLERAERWMMVVAHRSGRASLAGIG